MILTSEKDIAISTTLKIVTLMKRTPEKLHKQNRQMRLCTLLNLKNLPEFSGLWQFRLLYSVFSCSVQGAFQSWYLCRKKPGSLQGTRVSCKQSVSSEYAHFIVGSLVIRCHQCGLTQYSWTNTEKTPNSFWHIYALKQWKHFSVKFVRGSQTS